MKRVKKSAEPPALEAYRKACPLSEWESMRNDALHGGKAAYDAIVATLEDDQGGICAYCEIKISRDSNTTRVEHFVPKSLKDPSTNWALNWGNLLAVCNGGSQLRSVPGHYLEPHKENLSCDDHKGKVLGVTNSHGVLLDPLSLPAMLPLMYLEHASGKWNIHNANVSSISWLGNTHPTVSSLVEHTIEKVLNLNCDRLVRARLIVLRTIEKEIKRARHAGLDPSVFMANLSMRYLGPKYREFFSVYRFRLGNYAEQYLQSIGFDG